jgi:hypothetical protein
MLALRPDPPVGAPRDLPEASLPEVAATMAAWLGAAPELRTAPPIAALA